MRREEDSLGPVEIDDDAYYGSVTARNIRALSVGRATLADFPVYVRSYVLIKIACARANCEVGALDPKKAHAIEKAGWEIVNGQFMENFRFGFYRGSGTPLNMAVNEVIAHRANEILTGSITEGGVHPNNDVNMSQSSNDVSPTGKEIAVYEALTDLAASGQVLVEALAEKAEEFRGVIKMGRTCLQDAVPTTLGLEFSSYAHAAQRAVDRIRAERENWTGSCLGGTAIGTGMGCQPGFRRVIDKHLSDVVEHTMTTQPDLIDGITFADGMIVAHGMVQALATVVWRIARDIRLMSSGPRAGFGEIALPAVAPGSSIMPGKVNPVIPELAMSTANQVNADHSGLVMGLLAGWLELGSSSGIPVRSMLTSCDLLSRTMRIFAEKCIRGITADARRCLELTEKSTSLATMVSSILGYDAGTKVAKLALEEDITCKEAAKRLKVLPDAAIEELFDLDNLVDADKMESLLVKYAGYRRL